MFKIMRGRVTHARIICILTVEIGAALCTVRVRSFPRLVVGGVEDDGGTMSRVEPYPPWVIATSSQFAIIDGFLE